MRYALLTLSALCLLARPVVAQQDATWTLSTADFKTEQVALRSIDDAGVTVVPAGGGEPRVIPAAAFLQLDRGLPPVERPGKFVLHLAGAGGGDRVGGEPVKVENDQLTWSNAAVGELVVPLTQLAAITKSGQSPDPGKRTEDVVALANGDSVRGIVTSLAGGQVQVKPGGGADPVAVPLDAVVSIHFATAAAPAPPANGGGGDAPRLHRLRLDDGSTVVGSSLSITADGKLSLAIGGAAARPLDLARVVGIEQVNGPIRWLTSLTPSQDVYVPFVASRQPLWRTRIDTDVAGDPFVVGGRALKRGIGVHAQSRLVYPLDGSFKAFRTRYGINDSLVRADVTVRIRLGDKVVHEANVKAGVLSPVVVVELGDAKELVLEVDYGQGIDVEDRLNWLEPALLREVPKKEEAPATAPAAAEAEAPAPPGARPAAAKGQAPADAGGAEKPAPAPEPAAPGAAPVTQK